MKKKGSKSNAKKKIKKSAKRNIIKKNKRCCYSEKTLKLALEEVHAGKSIAECSKKYRIPESTLRDKKKIDTPKKNQGQVRFSPLQKKMN